MKKRVRLTKKQKVDIIHQYESMLTPMIDLANQYGVTRQGVHKILNKAGVDTSKHRLAVSCTVCGKGLMRTKARIRRQLNHFCDKDCQGTFLRAGNVPNINRNGQRIARGIVSGHFALQAQHVVHHENHNTLDNRLSNLMVFALQGDHIRYHHGFDVEPVWSGQDS